MDRLIGPRAKVARAYAHIADLARQVAALVLLATLEGLTLLWWGVIFRRRKRLAREQR